METPSFVEKAKYEEGFSKHYDEKIKPILQEVEEERLVQYKVYKKRQAIAVPVIVVIIVLSIFLMVGLGSGSMDLGWVVFVICGAIWMGWVRAPLRKYKTEVKSKFMPVVCSFFGDLTYSVKGFVDRPWWLSLDIIPRYNKIETEDFIDGMYKKFKIHMNEMILKRTTGYGKRRRTVTVFKGLVIVIGFPKSFKGKTVLKRDKGRFANWIDAISDLERIELEDPEFESIFEVYSSDQVEARFLLTTAFMERLLSLAGLRTGGKAKPSVQCEFYKSELVIMIPSTKDLFEPQSIDKSALDHDDIHMFLQQMDEVFQLIDVLKLEQV